MTHAYVSIPTTDPADTDTCSAASARRADTCVSSLVLRILMSVGLILHLAGLFLLDVYLDYTSMGMFVVLVLHLVAVVAHNAEKFRQFLHLFDVSFYWLMVGNALSVGGFARAHVWHWSVLAKIGLVAATFVVSCVWYRGCKWVLGKYAEQVFGVAQVRVESGAASEADESDGETGLKPKM
ncbi:hypothetical protein BCR44DRAFT_35488 [Catenaria anguillulae PL171]|uniref:Uncharacterized protein n=1 Tax=Catenaria anguillulae PL171 TaxID=765915 RepID=A0A1Y2HPX4_9FUNG|nr:hypothetical protein BCR44DRAFT_35488 [Catenaria anguillulae PL171]